MIPPVYSSVSAVSFGGLPDAGCSYEESRAIVLPVPFERTTSFVAGTRNAPGEILRASAQIELWDEETHVDTSDIGIVTLPEMELPFGSSEPALAEIRRIVQEIASQDKFLMVLGGEHTVTIPVVEAMAARYPGLSVLQIDAHADLRDSYLGNRFSHACAMRRVLDFAPCIQVGVRSISRDEADAVAELKTRIFYDFEMRFDAGWMDRVVEGLSESVYVTIDCDGLDPAIMPAVGTPEPGGLTWTELLTLLRKVFASRHVVGCDLVELCPIPGLVAPNVACARLVSKVLSYWFLGHRR